MSVEPAHPHVLPRGRPGQGRDPQHVPSSLRGEEVVGVLGVPTRVPPAPECPQSLPESVRVRGTSRTTPVAAPKVHRPRRCSTSTPTQFRLSSLLSNKWSLRVLEVSFPVTGQRTSPPSLLGPVLLSQGGRLRGFPRQVQTRRESGKFPSYQIQLSFDVY